jgi:hypothetical protein
MRLFRFCWTWCMNCSIYVYMLLDTWTLCINLMNVVISRLYFVLDCVFFYKLNADYVFYPTVTGWADVGKPVTTVDMSSDGQMTLAHPSLLWATVAVGVFVPSLLSYHYSGALVTTGRMPMSIVTYGLLLQCLIIVVIRSRLTRDPSCNWWIKRPLPHTAMSPFPFRQPPPSPCQTSTLVASDAVSGTRVAHHTSSSHSLPQL